jgi:hypothetical protein
MVRNDGLRARRGRRPAGPSRRFECMSQDGGMGLEDGSTVVRKVGIEWSVPTELGLDRSEP